MSVSVIFPTFYANQVGQKNNTCAIIKLNVGEQSIIFSGDAPIAAWKEILRRNNGQKIAANIVTVPHHGGCFTNRQEEIEEFHNNIVQSNYAIVSVGAKNKYHQPLPEVIKSFVEHDTIVLCTQKTPQCDQSLSDRSLTCNVACCGTIIADIETERIRIKNEEQLLKKIQDLPDRLCQKMSF
jgi:beta-lactamase superfamily II metal-dependent hydrolase